MIGFEMTTQLLSNSDLPPPKGWEDAFPALSEARERTQKKGGE